MRLYQRLAQTVEARLNCIASGNTEWKERHEERILNMVLRHMPRGSGVDNGTKIDLDRSTGEKLIFDTSYHHMVEGSYDGWTEHRVFVRGSLLNGIDVSLTGRDRNHIKDYLYEIFDEALRTEVPDPPEQGLAT